MAVTKIHPIKSTLKYALDYIMDADKYEHKDPVDGEEYWKWYDSYRKDAGTMTIPFMELTEENIANLK